MERKGEAEFDKEERKGEEATWVTIKSPQPYFFLNGLLWVANFDKLIKSKFK